MVINGKFQLAAGHDVAPVAQNRIKSTPTHRGTFRPTFNSVWSKMFPQRATHTMAVTAAQCLLLLDILRNK